MIEQGSALDNLIMTLRDNTQSKPQHLQDTPHTRIHIAEFWGDVSGDGWWLWRGGGGGGGEFFRIDKEAGNGDGGD